MMINIVLYNDESIIRIVQRAIRLFSNYKEYRTTRDTIWLNGMYLKFTPKMLILNIYDTNIYSIDEVISYLKKILLGEEVYISDNHQFQKYIDKVNYSTVFKLTSYEECV